MRRPALLCLLLLLAIAGAGCAGSESAAPVPAIESFAQVASATRGADSGRFALDLSLSAAGQKLSIGGAGSFDRASHATELTLDMSSFAKTLGALGGSAKLPGFDDPDNWKLQAVQLERVMYMKFPLLASQLNGAEWLKLDLDRLAALSGTSLGQFGAFGAGDPRAILDTLGAVSGSIEPLGRDDVRGVETSHYVAMLDPAKLAQAAAKQGASSDLVSKLASSFSQLGLGPLPLHVWIDDQQLVRKLTLDVKPSDSSAAAGMEVGMGLELFDYGTPVSISAPPASETVDASSLPGFGR